MTKYRKKPVVIEAIQTPLNAEKLAILSEWQGGADISVGSTGIVISTLEGEMTAGKGDWIIKGVKGELYPCKPDIFAATYEAVEIQGDTDPNPALEQLHSWFSQAALDVTAERRRQIELEGYGNRHDDAHTGFEIAKAAVAYAQRAAMSEDVRSFKEKRDQVPSLWPWARAWWKPKDRRSDLVRAAALLIAEIERLDRAEATS
ncbi:hypothetical protein CFBP5507_07895 [Agrobacterium salinitolerans]|uniref:Uncharacterized protein n=1 Tax=Agrobacterium salinitolerans TaxID=1183413 RepID=A0A9X9K7J4_9HYPH|nr:hypothetical protein [Agrobacterium salinitolerans]UYZ06183.1 hypothetical protein CFBP5507_07895 [Agrobacterium salinitolerans]